MIGDIFNKIFVFSEILNYVVMECFDLENENVIDSDLGLCDILYDMVLYVEFVEVFDGFCK